ncbi:hypothetical protein OG2516_11201 [Oceanicola granulosus HTCC2516]|uniref:Capsular polysaccharide biosynthesis protein n=1 Tax=Oceanicola granulosus (strain ATCC BAA-861 / DSM 15982 / KCTC 12143 / HTCC2516) TaxID=314256 RepID=Q2CJW3_OCEGH|nr:hypothetical protein [Oceanicola granulosus]EAR53026.1 hypothetical protein OG2516_11201 [Oceanicola granulosus HTCC2516]
MTEPRIVTFYLEDGLHRSARAGRHNFIGKLAGVLEASGYRVDFLPDSDVEIARSLTRGGWSMFHMAQPTGPRGLTFRRVYHYPFWRIEKRASRWEWDVARARFEGARIDRADAERFYGFWRKRLFGEAAAAPERAGFVYVPLQGKLLQRRTFQTMSPIEMLRHTLEQEPERDILVTLHPGERYDAEERAALDALAGGRVTVAEGMMEEALASCDYVVTQNSSAAFNGYFFGKPAVLFAKVDFHHIAASVERLGVAAAFEAVRSAEPDYAGYVWWFWQRMSLNAGRPEAERRIRKRLDTHGWP